MENARTDPRFSTRGNGEQPENALTGTWSRKLAGFSPSAIQVPSDFSLHRFWRDTSIAKLAPGGLRTLTLGTLGYEYDEAPLGVARPAGLAHLSATAEDVLCLQDYVATFTIATATHALTLYRHASGALVFSAGTVQWVWGLDDAHDVGSWPGRVSGAADPDIRQATLNLLADMGVLPETLQLGLVAATVSTDGTPPTSTINVPLPGSVLKPGQTIQITGAASDIDCRVAGVEISVNDGVTWRPAQGREAWSFKWMPTGNGPINIRSRAFDDSGNIEESSPGVAVTVSDVSWAPILLIVVATCIQKRSDLHSAAFSTRINCDQRPPQTRDNCE